MSTFTLTEEQYLKACFKLSKRSLLIRSGIIILIFSILLVNQAGLRTIDYISSGLLLLAIALVGPYIAWKYRVKKLFNSEASFKIPVTFSLSEDLIKLESEKGSALISWSDILKHQETTEFFLIFTNPKFARIIPKSGLSNDDLTKLTQYLKKEKRS